MASTSEPAKPTISGEHPRPRGGRREPLLWRGLRKVWYAMGPGFITGASDDDPSGIATYSQTGAHYGYALLWTAVWQLPLLYYTQEAVARIGAVRGKGLASAIREHHGLPLAVLLAALVVVADTINAGADIGAVAGSAHLVLPISTKVLVVLTTTLVLVCVVFVGYRRYANILKFLGLFLLAYLVTVFAVSHRGEPSSRAPSSPTSSSPPRSCSCSSGRSVRRSPPTAGSGRATRRSRENSPIA